jgi:hypothetical protein
LYETNFDLVFVCETWLNDELADGLLLYNNSNVFNVIRRDRTCNRGGGICLFIKKNYHFIIVPVPIEFSDLEILCVDVLCNNFRHRFICVYRPPVHNVHLMESITMFLNHLCDVNFVCTICGNFNMPNINWFNELDPPALPLLEGRFASFIVDNGLLQLITQPTRMDNILDLLLVNDPIAIYDVAILPPFSTSDHCAIAWHTWVPSTQTDPSDRCFDFRHADYDALSQYFGSFDWVNLFTSVAPNDIEGLWRVFKRVLWEAIALFTPLRNNNCKRPLRNYPEYLQRAIKLKRSLWRARRLEGGSSRYKAQARKCKKLIKKYHLNEERRLLSNGSSAAFYKHVNRKLNSSHHVAPLRVNNAVLTNDNDRANAFNNYFASVFNNKRNADIGLSLADVNDCSPPVDFSPTVTYEALRAAKHNYSSGPDLIPSIFWANLAPSLSLPVSIIFSTSYRFSIIPSDWKCAAVLPLFKKGDPSSVSNYRPISLTSTLCKIMESVIKNNLQLYALSKHLFSVEQHGFLPGRSTCTQLLECHHDWCSGLDQNEVFDVILLDFRKAFDVVPHEKLLTKLAGYGICLQTLNWIKTFLSDRTQFVQINDKRSTKSAVCSGVIQGSVIGPLLFTFYINDLPSVCHECTVKLFADDVKVYKRLCSPSDRTTLQSSLNAICNWARYWELDLSVDKCLYFQLGYCNLCLIYSINSTAIAPCSEITDLGVKVQSNLKPNLHCASIVAKANARAKLILKTFMSRDPHIIARAFVSYVRPMLEYCSPVWNPCCKTNIDLIESVQRTFTRKLFYFCHLSPYSYDERLAFLGMQRLELRRIHADLIFMFKLTHNLILSSLTNLICYSSSRTRGHRYKLFICRTNKLVLSTCFINRVSPIWNALPDVCFDVDVLSAFKRKILNVDFTNFIKGRF